MRSTVTSAGRLNSGILKSGEAGAQRKSHGSAFRPKNPASCPGQIELSVLKMCDGSRTALGRTLRGVETALTTEPTLGQLLGNPGLAFSAFKGECGRPVSM